MKDYKDLMVFAEQKEDRIHPIAYQLLGRGTEIADKLGVKISSVLLGNQTEEQAKELIYYGADKVFLYTHPDLKEFDLLNYKYNA